MANILKILLLEDSGSDAELLERFLHKEIPGCRVLLAKDKRSFLDAIDDFKPDIILSDHSLPQFDSEDALKAARSKMPNVPFILVTGTVSEEYAVNIIKQGADDYILKDRIRRLPAAIGTTLQKKKSENSIRHSEAIRRLIMNSALDAIVCINTNGSIIVWTPQAEKMFGWSEEEMLDRNLDETIIPVQLREKHLAGFKNYLQSGESRMMGKVVELSALKKSGEEFPIEILIIPIQEDGNEFFCAFIRDITERKKSEKKIIESEKIYRTIFQNSPLSKWIYDTDSLQFLEVNEAAVRHYGYSREEFLNMTIKDIRPEEETENLLKDIVVLNTGIDAQSGIWQHRKKNGTLIIVETNSHPIEFNGKSARMVIANDITEKRKLELKLREHQKEEQVKITATALEAQERERHAIGTELHDNVNQILVGTKLLLASVKNVPEREILLVRSCIDNLQDAIDENRKLAHILVTPDLETESLVEQIKWLCKSMLEIAGVKVIIDTSQYDEMVLSQEIKIAIYRIAQEQCTNIVKYAAASAVNISLSNTHQQFKMTIADDGLGMEANKTTQGIGLRNINSRLSVLKGNASILTAPGKGFILEIEFPF